MIRIDGLRKSYGALAALDRVSLHVERGAVHGLIGPNGAGKTTMIRIIAGLLAPDEGRVTVDGVCVTDDPMAARSLVGWMPDFFGVYGELTAAEYIRFFGEAHGVEAAALAHRTPELLERVGLSHKAGERVGDLSRGMIQRLVFARALVHDPPVLLLDEPASGLDPRARVELRGIVRTLAAEGKTILVSSHILAELSEMTDRIAIIEKGRLVFDGTLDDAAKQEAERDGGRRYLLRVVASTAAIARPIIAGRAEIVAERETGAAETEFRVALKTDADLDALLRELVERGARVRHLDGERDMERIFLDMTAGETQ